MASTVVQPPVADVNSVTDPVYSYASDNGFFTASFASAIGTDDAVKFTTGGYSFAWKPENVIYVDDQGNMDVVFGVNAQASAQVWKNRVSYVGTSQITTDIFDCDNNQLKHTIQMVAPPRIPAGYVGTPVKMASGGVITYDSSLQVFADGQVQTTDFEVTGDIGFKDAEGNLIYKLPMITVEDANGNSTTGTYKVTFNADGTISFYGMVPWDFLQTAAYPVLIDPTVVTTTSYTTHGCGRKQVRLSDGSMVIITEMTNKVQLFKSTDGGNTWTAFYSPSLNVTNIYGTSIASDVNDNIHFAFCYLNTTNSNNTGVDYYRIDKNGTQLSSASPHQTYASSASTMFQNPAIALNSNGDVMIGFSTKYNGTGTPMSNWQIWAVRLPSGGSFSGGVSVLSASTDMQYCDVVAFSNNYFGVVASSAYSVGSAIWNGSSWVNVSSTSIYNPGSSYSTNAVSSCVDGNDKWIVALMAYNPSATVTNAWHTLFSTSTNYGSSWSTVTDLTGTSASASVGSYRPTVTVDGNNNVYVYAAQVDPNVSTTYTQILRIIQQNGTWGSWTTLTNNTSNGCDYPYALFQKFNMNSSDAVRYIYTDNQAAKIEYDSYSLNHPPNAPMLTQKVNFDATQDAVFTATFSDPDSGNTMSARQMQIVDTSLGTTVYDTGKVGQTTTVQNQQFTMTVPKNTLTNGKQYQWREMTWDQSGAASPWSAYSAFNTAAAPTVTITNPTASATVATSSLTVSLSVSDPGNYSEQSYEVILEDANGNVIEDSGVINGAGNQLTLQTVLANVTTYKVYARATNSQGVTGTSPVITFSTSFTPPAAAMLTLSPQNGFLQLVMSNPAPSGSQPAAAYNDVYRRKSGETTWSRIATNLQPNSTYYDYAVASGQAYDYKVTTVGNNSTSTDSTVVTSSLTLNGVWLHDPLNPTGTVRKFSLREQKRSFQTQYTQTMMQFEGRSLPVADIADQKTQQMQVTILCKSDSDDLTDLYALADAQTTVLYRDNRGRKVFGVIAALPEDEDFWGVSVQLTIQAVDYQEVV